MYEEFKGFKVPRPHDDTTYNSVMSRTVDKFNAGHDTGKCGSVYCSGICCSGCLFSWCSWCGEDRDKNIQAFAVYARRLGYKITRKCLSEDNNSMPELVPGMVIKTTDGAYYLYVGTDKLKTLRITACGREADFSVIGSYNSEIEDTRIASIFYWDDESSDYGKGLCSYNVGKVLRGDVGEFSSIREWKKHSPVKMTVSEISEKLGYDVEIIADNK